MSIGELNSTDQLSAGGRPLSDSAHAAVTALTHRLFAGPVSIERESDPEFPSEYFVVTAGARGGVEELVELHHRWHVELQDVAGDQADHYRLSMQLQ
jgi:hypothetical protein